MYRGAAGNAGGDRLAEAAAVGMMEGYYSSLSICLALDAVVEINYPQAREKSNLAGA
jgi:hypothetical protein